MKIILTCLALPIFLIGCAAGTVNELRSDPANSIHVEIKQNYQRVYKNLLEKMRECMGEGWAGAFAQFHIRHAMYNELREANISFVMSNLGQQNHYLQVDIRGLEDEKTKLDAFIYFPTWKSTLAKVQPWATDEKAKCDANSQ